MKGLEIGEKEGDVTMSPLHTLSSLSFSLVACHVPRLFLSPPSSGCGREILSCEESVTENLRNKQVSTTQRTEQEYIQLYYPYTSSMHSMHTPIECVVLSSSMLHARIITYYFACMHMHTCWRV